MVKYTFACHQNAEGRYLNYEADMKLVVCGRSSLMRQQERNSAEYSTFRYNPIIEHIEDAIKGKRFGKITYTSISVPWWRDEAYFVNKWHGTSKMDGGGALMNQSIRIIDLLQYLMGPIEREQFKNVALHEEQGRR